MDPDAPKTGGPTIADNVTGMYAAYGILGALFDRERSGSGRRVEVNMFESAVSFIPDSFSNFTKLKLDNGPRTRVATSQSYAFRCADDRLLALHLSSPSKFWEGLLRVIERPDLKDDPRFSTRDGRVRAFAELEAVLADAFRQKERAYWIDRLQAADVPFAPVQTIPEVLQDEQICHLGTFYEDVHPTEGRLTLVRRPVLIDGQRDMATKPPPTLGEHTAEILGSVEVPK
jgi:formyl-CoA transferase